MGYRRLCSFYTRAGGRITARIAWYDEGRIDWTATLVVRHSNSDSHWLMDTSFLQKSISICTGIYSFVGSPRFRRANTAFYSKQYYSRRARSEILNRLNRRKFHILANVRRTLGSFFQKVPTKNSLKPSLYGLIIVLRLCLATGSV